MSCEIGRNSPLTVAERVFLGLFVFWPVFFILAVSAICCGCRSESTGVSAAVGDITTLPEISDATDNISVKVLYMMTGARVWTAKDSNVTVNYRNCYTNDYIGIFHTRGTQDLRVNVEPVEYVSSGTNSSPCSACSY